jgi:hypothetical protein
MLVLAGAMTKSALILTVIAEDELPLKSVLPLYWAVMEFDPLGRDDVARVAMLETPLDVRVFGKTDAVPIWVPPLENVTVPDGKPAVGCPANAELVTFAVRVIEAPLAPLVGEALRPRAVLACVIVKATGTDVLGLKLASPW